MTTRDTIIDRLRTIEHECSVVVLFAVESGSRAWGFESTDSDYDVRFVYKHGVNWYLSIKARRDVLEFPLINNLDFSGWDVQKALRLFLKSNPPLLEWIKSPIIYLEQGTFRNDLLALQTKYFSPRSAILHYLHMARGNYREYLKGDIVRVKKYFYVLRPLLACDWILARATPPPMEFEVMMREIVHDASLTDEIEKLLRRKRSGTELGEEPPIPIINRYIESRLDYLESRSATFKPSAVEADHLDLLFRETIGM
jgi:hypothetical protein